MENNENQNNETYEIEEENDEHIVSLQNEEDVEQKGYRISTLDGEVENETYEEENTLEDNLQKENLSNSLEVNCSDKNAIIEKEISKKDLNYVRTTSIGESQKKTITNLKSLEKVNPKFSIFEKENLEKNYDTYSHRESVSRKMDFDKPNGINKEKALYNSNEIENLKEKVNIKISSLGNMHVFCLNYVNIILKIFKEFTDILFRKISTTLNQNKKFLKYFRDVIESYKKFCLDLEKANINITTTNDENQLLSDNITNLIVTTQNTITNNFEGFSKNLNETLISNGPFQKIKDILISFENIKKNVATNFKNLEYKKDQMVKKFNGKSVPIFTKFKKFENQLEIKDSLNKNIKELNNLFEENDFFLIEIELFSRVNKLFNKLTIFLNSYKTSLEDLKKCVIEYASLVKDTVEKFLFENKRIYGGNMNLDFEHMQKFYESITKESLEKSFIVSRILGSDNTINKFNEYFNEYRNNLIKFRIVINEEISKHDKFNISNFQSIEDLISFMLSLIPVEKKLSSSLLIGKYDLLRDPGYFKSWKNCIIVKTLQNNILIYDEKINKKPIEIFNIKKLKLIMKGDKKNPNRFEISEKKKGLLFNSNKIQYLDAVSDTKLIEIKKSFNIDE